jgi:hypothetical protein
MRKVAGQVLLMAGVCLSGSAHAGENDGALAVISVNPQDSGIEVVGSVLAIDAGLYRGELIIDRQGASGKVSTRQAREVTLAAGATADIARVGISYNSGDDLTVTVKLTRDGAVISRATLSTAEN